MPATPFIGEISVFAGTFAPAGWALCDGSLRNIADYPSLHSLIGTTYGGDGVTTFGLPDLRGRVVPGACDIAESGGSGGSGGCASGGSGGFFLGDSGGVSSVELEYDQFPASHEHAVTGSLLAVDGQGDSSSPTDRVFAASDPADPDYAAPNGELMEMISGIVFDQAVGDVGGNEPHTNRQPTLGLNYIIALEGVFPS